MYTVVQATAVDPGPDLHVCSNQRGETRGKVGRSRASEALYRGYLPNLELLSSVQASMLRDSPGANCRMAGHGIAEVLAAKTVHGSIERALVEHSFLRCFSTRLHETRW